MKVEPKIKIPPTICKNVIFSPKNKEDIMTADIGSI